MGGIAIRFEIREKMKTKNILLVSHYFGVTGAPISLLRHAKYMLSAGYRVDVWTLDYSRDNGLEPEYLSAGLSIRHVKNDEAEVADAMRGADVRYDLILCNTICTYKCVNVFQRMGIPTIWFVRETVLVDEWAIKNPSFRNVFIRFYNIYCPSEYTASQIRFYNKNIRVVRNAIGDDFSGYAPMADTLRLGYIGAIHPAKGVDVLVDAFLNVCNRLHGMTLCIAGRTVSQYARGIVAKTQGNSSVVWLGEIRGTDKKRFFDSIDVLCVPSLEEPFGLTVVEGAMYGKVVITTDRTGAKCFAEGIEGAIVKAGSVKAMEKALLHFSNLGSRNLRLLQERARALYLKYGTTDREREDVLKMVEDNLNNTPPPAMNHWLDDMLEGHTLLSRALRKAFRLYLNLLLKIRSRGEWSAIASRCS